MAHLYPIIYRIPLGAETHLIRSFQEDSNHVIMLGVDVILIIIVSLVLSLVIVLYIALVLKFVLRKTQQKEIPDDPQTSFIERMSGLHPFRVANTKCVPIQPRTYDELKKVKTYVYILMVVRLRCANKYLAKRDIWERDFNLTQKLAHLLDHHFLIYLSSSLSLKL